MKLLKKGKVKDIYQIQDDLLLIEFTDRVSAFDVVLPDFIPQKGEVLCKFAEYWFKTLPTPNHMVRVTPPNKMIVKKLKIIPIECIIRGYLYGSLYERVQKGLLSLETNQLAAKLSKPYFETTTKFEETDRPITFNEIISKGWLSHKEYNWIKDTSLKIYSEMTHQVSNTGFVLADLKIEFGKTETGEILLADSIGPDEFRLWVKENYKPGQIQESYDKQPLRDWLTKIEYKKNLDDSRTKGINPPFPPKIPNSLIQTLSKRYIYAYEKITGLQF